MGADVQWWVWLVAGLGTGLIPALGENKALGWLQALLVIAGPFYIFIAAGANYLPFALFFGGLIVTTSLTYKRRTANEHRERKAAQAEKKRRWS